MTVTVWGVFQLEVVNVSDVLSRLRSVPAWPLTVTVAVAVGTCESLTE